MPSHEYIANQTLFYKLLIILKTEVSNGTGWIKCLEWYVLNFVKSHSKYCLYLQNALEFFNWVFSRYKFIPLYLESETSVYAQLTVTWIGQVLGSIGTKGPETGTAYHAIFLVLKSSNSLRWLNILIQIGTNQFWWAPRLSIMFKHFLTSYQLERYPFINGV